MSVCLLYVLTSMEDTDGLSWGGRKPVCVVLLLFFFRLQCDLNAAEVYVASRWDNLAYATDWAIQVPFTDCLVYLFKTNVYNVH